MLSASPPPPSQQRGLTGFQPLVPQLPSPGAPPRPLLYWPPLKQTHPVVLPPSRSPSTLSGVDVFQGKLGILCNLEGTVPRLILVLEAMGTISFH